MTKLQPKWAHILFFPLSLSYFLGTYHCTKGREGRELWAKDKDSSVTDLDWSDLKPGRKGRAKKAKQYRE